MEALKTNLQLLKIIIDNLPFPVFIKNEERRYTFINDKEAQLFGLDESEILGKSDAEFIKNRSEIKVIEDSDLEVLLGKKIELPNQMFSLQNGNSYIFKTYKFPFTNPYTGKINIFGLSTDVTDSVSLNKLKKILSISSNPYL